MSLDTHMHRITTTAPHAKMPFNPDVLREYVRTKVQTCITNTGLNMGETFQNPENIPKNIEIGIFNYCMKRARAKRHEVLHPPQPHHANTVMSPDWDCKRFREMYKHKALSVIYSMEKYPEVIHRLYRKEFPSWKLAYLKPWEVDDSKWSGIFEKLAKINFFSLSADAMIMGEDYKGLMQCGRCKGHKTTYYSVQTRCADEPMTNFWTCLDCKKRWKT